MDARTERDELKAIVATFPAEFRLEAGPGRRMPEGLKFRIDERRSFYDRGCGFQLVTQVWSDEREAWLDWSRGSVEQLRSLVRPLEG